MAIYAVGGEADCYEPVSGQTFVFDTTGGRFDANACRGGQKILQGTSEIELFFPGGNQTEIWVHMNLYIEALANADGYLVFQQADGDDVYRLNLNADGSIEFDFWSGAAWVNLATSAAAAVAATTLFDLDFHILDDGTTGTIDIYVDGVSVLTFGPGDTRGDNTGVGRILFSGTTGGTNEFVVSQVIVASESTIGWKLATNHATGNGANTAWDGDYTDIDEADLDTGNFIQTDVVDEVETFTNENINAAYSTYSVKAVVVAARANNDVASSIGDIQAALRLSGVNYFSTDLSLPQDSADHSVQAIFETNPDTTDPWTQSEVNGAEFGVKSVV